MEPPELRFRILQALLEWEHSEDSRMLEVGQLANRFGVSTHDVVDQLDILEIQAAVEVNRALGDGSSNTAFITGVGKKMVEEMKQSQAPSTGRASVSEPTGEAIKLLEEVTRELWEKDLNIVASLRKCLHAVRLLGWEEDWISKELDGYPVEEAPSWREATGTSEWLNANQKVIKKSVADFYLTQPLVDLNYRRRTGSSFLGGKEKKVKGIKCFEVLSVNSLSIEIVLNRITERLFNYASKALVALRFGQTTENAFRQYQDSVSNALVKLGIEDYLKAVYQNLLCDDEASWQTGVLACRNILHKLSEMLWQAPGNVYPYLNAKDGSPMRITRNDVRNRIRAYLHQKGLRSDDMLMRTIDPLYSMASSGKGSVSYEHAQSVMLYTYIFLGEMIRLTDMQPLKEIQKV